MENIKPEVTSPNEERQRCLVIVCIKFASNWNIDNLVEFSVPWVLMQLLFSKIHGLSAFSNLKNYISTFVGSSPNATVSENPKINLVAHREIKMLVAGGKMLGCSGVS